MPVLLSFYRAGSFIRKRHKIYKQKVPKWLLMVSFSLVQASRSMLSNIYNVIRYITTSFKYEVPVILSWNVIPTTGKRSIILLKSHYGGAAQ
jgi:hypothetical protein